ncbi:hypothetical protein KFE25_000830 [Diacronema lutheri]|uniref:Carbohydrate kinase PfkB domain-containing protein n=1 Tax=Diacronema lutheri TaxID=2081491 RepID=A0A8J6CCF7_DIALT|nr:hypothetical protein KFE25_000830 [Diacronema lutheri]
MASTTSALAPAKTVVGLGEVLWDVFSPSERLLGGAPSNFAYAAAVLGHRGVVASRIGDDALGIEARALLSARGVDTRFVQTSARLPTGRVLVTLADGQPSYEIERGAWDELELTAEWERLAREADAVCYGSLAQREVPSRTAIAAFLAATRADCLRVFDVNLRQAFFSGAVLTHGLGLARVCKLNDDEAQPLLGALELAPAATLDECADRLLGAFRSLSLVCITRGERGALLASRAARVNAPAANVERVVDTIGAGDAFTAALVHALLAEPGDTSELDEAALASAGSFAARYAAHVCAHAGGMPEPPAWLTPGAGRA